jgi:hypothetical protein
MNIIRHISIFNGDVANYGRRHILAGRASEQAELTDALVHQPFGNFHTAESPPVRRDWRMRHSAT